MAFADVLRAAPGVVLFGHLIRPQVAVFGIAVLLAVLAVEIAVRAAEPGHREIVQHGWGLAVMVGVLLVNVAVTTWERTWARRLNSEILRADSQHTLSDVLVTIGVIAGWRPARRASKLDILSAIATE